MLHGELVYKIQYTNVYFYVLYLDDKIQSQLTKHIYV